MSSSYCYKLHLHLKKKFLINYSIHLVVLHHVSTITCSLLVFELINFWKFYSFQLYEALHVGEYQIRKERELLEKLEMLNSKLGPLEQVNMSKMRKWRRKNLFINLFTPMAHLKFNYKSIFLFLRSHKIHKSRTRTLNCIIFNKMKIFNFPSLYSCHNNNNINNKNHNRQMMTIFSVYRNEWNWT